MILLKVTRVRVACNGICSYLVAVCIPASHKTIAVYIPASHTTSHPSTTIPHIHKSATVLPRPCPCCPRSPPQRRVACTSTCKAATPTLTLAYNKLSFLLWNCAHGVNHEAINASAIWWMAYNRTAVTTTRPSQPHGRHNHTAVTTTRPSQPHGRHNNRTAVTTARPSQPHGRHNRTAVTRQLRLQIGKNRIPCCPLLNSA